MKWSEMSIMQKLLSVTGWLCAAVWLVSVILDETGVLNVPVPIRHALFGVWCLGNGVQRERFNKVMWYVLAGAYLLLCLKHLL